MVGLDQALRIGGACGWGWLEVVDGVAEVAGEFLSLVGFCGRRAGFCELPCDASDFDDGAFCRVGEHDSHLEHDLEQVADAFGGVLCEGFGAIASLEDEGLSLRGFGEPSF